jgi:hypothetical protein
MAKNKEQKLKREPRIDPSGIFVPAGLLIGMGVGFVYNNLPAGLFTGLGIGLLIMAILKLIILIMAILKLIKKR